MTAAQMPQSISISVTSPLPDSVFDPLFGAVGDPNWFPSPAHVMRRAAILEMIAHLPSGRLIEFGCGAGRLLADWHQLGHSGLAVEPDDLSRGLAKEICDRLNLGFKVSSSSGQEQFDYLVSTEVLEHIDEPQAALAEWVKSLKPGGHALLTVPAFARLWGASDEWAGHVQRFEPDDFVRMIEQAGLDLVEIRLFGYPIGNMLRVIGNGMSAIKIRRRSNSLDRTESTFASGRDRSIETSLSGVMRSAPFKALLHAAISLQRRTRRGHGLIVLAQKSLA